MASIKPFRAYRPVPELADRIAALPYDVYNRKEALEEIKRQPYSFLRVDRPESHFSEEVDTYDLRVYAKAKEVLWNMVASGELMQEDVPMYYLYELCMNGRKQQGLVACASVDDYLHGVIKKHENTREDKELDRIRHVDTTGAQTGPIFLAYRAVKEIDHIVNRKLLDNPLYDFVSPDGILHKVWKIDAPEEIATIEQSFAKMQEIYIADGHHRCASAVKVSMLHKAEGQEPAERDFFLSVLFPDNQLMIMDYNRVVKDLAGYTKEEFLSKVLAHYQILAQSPKVMKPGKKGELSMYLDSTWYLLQARDEILDSDPVRGLDVSLLQDYVLDQVLGIKDPKTDKRIDFVGGIRGYEELEKRVQSDCAVAFGMYPTSIEELFAVADAGLLMPPKSTWFEPKLRSGLFIHDIR